MGGLMNLRVLYSTILGSLIKKICILQCGLMIFFTWSWCGQILSAEWAVLDAIGSFVTRYPSISLCTVYGRNGLVFRRLIVLDLQILLPTTLDRYNMFVKSFQQSCMILSSSYNQFYFFCNLLWKFFFRLYKHTK